MWNSCRCPSLWRLARLRVSRSRLFYMLLRTLRSMRRSRMLNASARAENRAGSEGRQRGNERGSEGREDSTAIAKNSGLWSRAATAELYHTHTHTSNNFFIPLSLSLSLSLSPSHSATTTKATEAVATTKAVAPTILVVATSVSP